MKFKNTSLKGFSLIELMIVIAIIGILASIAVPSYRSYIYKAKASEVYSAITAAELAVADYLTTTAATSASCPTASFPAYSFSSTPNVSSVTIDTACKVTGTANSANLGFSLTAEATPTVQTDGSIKWTCATTAGKAYAPATCP